MKSHFLCLLILPVLLPAQSLVSTFDPPTFRVPEKLWGQGPEGFPWKGDGSDLFLVRPNGGLDNSACLRVNPMNRDFAPAVWELPPHALGLTPESLLQSRVAFRFSIKLDENQGDTVISRVFLAGGAVSLELYSQGTGFTFDGAKPPEGRHVTLRGPENSRTAFPAGEWIHVSGVMDYAAKSFTVRINDIDQNGGQPIGFLLDDARQPDAGKLLDISFNTMRQTHTDWGPYTLDNVAFSLAP